MAIYAHEWNGCQYLRVVRTWDGQQYQRYIPIDPKKPEKSRKEAEVEDESLRQRQRAFFMRDVYRASYHVREDGRIKGVFRDVVTRQRGDSSYIEDRFRYRIRVPWDDSPTFGTVSIKRYGVDGAHRIVVERYCDAFGFDVRSELRKTLLATLPAYLGNAVVTVPTRDADDNDALMGQLQREMKEFAIKRKKGVIRG